MKSNFTLNLIFVIFISFSLTFTFQSCSVDKCESVECLNGGVCKDGICDCPPDFSGSKCENDNRPECEKNNTAEVIFENWSSNPYDCYVNNVYKGRVNGGNTLKATTSAGFTTYKTIQVSGYVFYPSEFSGSSTIEKCEGITFIFP